MNCSDSHLAYVCSSCGGLLAVYLMPVNQRKGDDHESGNIGKGKGAGMDHLLAILDSLDPLSFHCI